MKSQPICGPLGPKSDGSCANNGRKTKSGTFGLWKVLHSRNFRFCGVVCTEAIKVRPQWTTNWLRFHKCPLKVLEPVIWHHLMILRGGQLRIFGAEEIENRKLGGPSPGILRLIDSFDAKVNEKIDPLPHFPL